MPKNFTRSGLKKMYKKKVDVEEEKKGLVKVEEVDYYKRPDLKKLHVKPNPIKPEEEKSKEVKGKEEEKKFVEIKEPEPIRSPMQEFFDDMGIIMYQVRDPYLRKPSFDIGGPVIQNYLLWLQLSELMKINKKLSDSVIEKLNKEEKSNA